MTSLSKQLGRLRSPTAIALLVDAKFRTSLLFDPQEAAKLQRDDFYAIGINGIDALSELDETFHQYRATLFAPSTVSLELALQDRETAKRFNDEVRQFLSHVHPYLQHSAAHKAIEWLLYRFRIHQENTDELIACALPFHETNIFVRILQTVDLRVAKLWHFLEPFQRRGSQLPRSVLVTQCIRDHSVLQFVCDLATRFYAPYFTTRTDELCPKLSAVYSFQCATLLGVLHEAAAANAGKSRLTNELFSFISGVVFRGLSSQNQAASLDTTFSSVALFTELIVKHSARLTSEFFQEGVKMLLSNEFLVERFPDLVLGLVALLFDRCAIERLGKRQFERLLGSSEQRVVVFESLKRVAKQTDTSRFLRWFQSRLIETTRRRVAAAFDCGCRRNAEGAENDEQLANRLDFLNNMMSEFPIGDQETVRNVIDIHRNVFGDQQSEADERVRRPTHQLVRTCQLRFAKHFDAVLSDSGRDEMLLKLAVGSGSLEVDDTVLFVCVHHAEPTVRISALRFIEQRLQTTACDSLSQLVSSRLLQEEHNDVLALLCGSGVLLGAADCDSLLAFVRKRYSVMPRADDTLVDAATTKWLEKLRTQQPTLRNGSYLLALLFASSEHDLRRVTRVAQAADCAVDTLLPLLGDASNSTRRLVTQLLTQGCEPRESHVERWNAALLETVCNQLEQACTAAPLADVTTAQLAGRMTALLDGQQICSPQASQLDRKAVVLLVELTLLFARRLAESSSAQQAALASRASLVALHLIDWLLVQSCAASAVSKLAPPASWVALGDVEVGLEASLGWLQSLISCLPPCQFHALEHDPRAFDLQRSFAAAESPVQRTFDFLLRLGVRSPTVRLRVHSLCSSMLVHFRGPSAVLSFLSVFTMQQLVAEQEDVFAEAVAMLRRELSRTGTQMELDSPSSESLTLARYLLLLSCLAMNSESERVRRQGVKLVDALCSNVDRLKLLCATAADRVALHTLAASDAQIAASRHVVSTIVAQLVESQADIAGVFCAVLRSPDSTQLCFFARCVSLLANVDTSQWNNAAVASLTAALLHFLQSTIDRLERLLVDADVDSALYSNAETLLLALVTKLAATKCKFDEVYNHDACWNLLQRCVLHVCVASVRSSALRRTLHGSLKKSFFKQLSAAEKQTFLDRVCVRLCDASEPLDNERITLLRTLLRRLVCALRVDEAVALLRAEMDACHQTDAESRRHALVRVLQFLTALAAKKHDSFELAVALLPRLSKLLSQFVAVQRSAYAQRMDVDMSAAQPAALQDAQPSENESSNSDLVQTSRGELGEQVKFATLVCMDKLVACVVQHDVKDTATQREAALADVSIESVVECVRDSDDPQLVHRAMQLLAALATLMPDTVIDNVISIFVFVGSSLTRQDDQFTFDASLKLIRTLVPILCAGLAKRPDVHANVARTISNTRPVLSLHAAPSMTRSSEAEEKYDDEARICSVVVRILVVFVDAFARIPEYRRLAVFEELVYALIRQERAANAQSTATAPSLVWLLAVLLHSAAVKSNAAQKTNNVDPAESLAAAADNDSVRQFALRLFRTALGFSSTLALCARLVRFVRDAHCSFELLHSNSQPGAAAHAKVQLAKRKRRQPVGLETGHDAAAKLRTVTDLLLTFNQHTPTQFAALIVRLLQFVIEALDRADRSALPVLEDAQRLSAHGLITAATDYSVWLQKNTSSCLPSATRNSLAVLARRSLDALAHRLTLLTECTALAARSLHQQTPPLGRAAVCEMLTRRVLRATDVAKQKRADKDAAPSEEPEQLGALVTLVDTCNEQISECSTCDEASYGTYLASLLRCVEHMARFVHAARPSDAAFAKLAIVFKTTLSKTVALLAHADKASTRHHDVLLQAIACATQLLETLPAKLVLELVPSLVTMLVSGLDSAANGTDAVPATRVAWLKLTYATFERLGRFLSSHLSSLLVTLCRQRPEQSTNSLATHRESSKRDAQPADGDANTQLTALYRLIATQTSARLLLPAIQQCYQTLFDQYAKQSQVNQFADASCRLAELYRMHLEKVPKTDLDANLPVVFSTYLESFLLCREQLAALPGAVDLRRVDEIEATLFEPLKVVAFRVSESVFRTYFSRIVRWAQDESLTQSKAPRRDEQAAEASETRTDVGDSASSRMRPVTLYNLCSTFASEMEGLFNLFVGLVVPHLAQQLGSISEQHVQLQKLKQTKKKSKKRSHEELDDNTIVRMGELRVVLRAALQLIRISCEQDAASGAAGSSAEMSDVELRFLNHERYNLLAQPLVTQLENDLLFEEGSGSGPDSLDAHVRTALVQFVHATLTLHGEKQLSKFFQLIAQRLRDENSRIRLRALTLIRDCTERLGKDSTYKTVLNEFSPYIAEMNADPVDQIEELAGSMMQQIEFLVGESIREQL